MNSLSKCLLSISLIESTNLKKLCGDKGSIFFGLSKETTILNSSIVLLTQGIVIISSILFTSKMKFSIHILIFPVLLPLTTRILLEHVTTLVCMLIGICFIRIVSGPLGTLNTPSMRRSLEMLISDLVQRNLRARMDSQLSSFRILEFFQVRYSLLI